MIYLDNGATSFHKPTAVYRAVGEAMRACANPGRGGYGAAVEGQINALTYEQIRQGGWLGRLLG